MSNNAGRAGRHLLLRGYIVLVGSLLAVALLIDLGLQWLTPEDEITRELATAVFNNTELSLRQLDDDQRIARLRDLSVDYGFDVSLVPFDDVAGVGDIGVQEMHDDDERSWFMRAAPQFDGYLRIGPFERERSVLADWVSPLFYLAVMVVIGVWAWPLVRDLNLISDSAQAFAADYRKPIKTAGRTTALTGLATNLDEMSARIHSLIENQKELTSALSHEMRTPLARIRFALAVVEDKLDGETSRQINNDVTEIDRLIATLLDYARLDHPGTELQWQMTPVTAWLDETVQKARDLGPVVSIDNQIGDSEIRIDPQLMGLAVSNLLVNAARYADRHVNIGVRRDNSHLLFTIDDDGPGIPEDQRTAVFEAFTRLDNSRNKQTGGYGLGLAIARRIAQLHGGEITASASPQGGARLTITIPATA
ncbi:MAG: hypothetical protein KJO55_10630 [Gammaproteobacteria bacterium]|nr:hypothetical protein [Gammaproteobacteria bacterium]